MWTTLKRVLERGATNGMFRKPTATRYGLQQTPQPQLVPVPARTRP
jgi:hypothetical protein